MMHFPHGSELMGTWEFFAFARYLPGISAAQPGLRIGFERAGLATRFPDAVAPYCHFGCDVRRRFPGTFFRFPLR
jgi:sacsin